MAGVTAGLFHARVWLQQPTGTCWSAWGAEAEWARGCRGAQCPAQGPGGQKQQGECTSRAGL